MKLKIKFWVTFIFEFIFCSQGVEQDETLIIYICHNKINKTHYYRAYMIRDKQFLKITHINNKEGKQLFNTTLKALYKKEE